MVTNTENENINPYFLEILEQKLITKIAQTLLQKEIRKDPVLADHVNLSEQVSQVCRNVPEGRRLELLKLIQDFVDKSKHEPIIPLPTSKTEMKDAGIETYREFVARTRSRDGKRCLEENWGKFLKAFTPSLDRDYMSKNDLRNLDAQLLKRLEGQYNTEEIAEFLPSKPSLNLQIVKAMTKEERREIFRLNSMLRDKLPVV